MPVYNPDGTAVMTQAVWEETLEKAQRLDRMEAANGYAVPANAMDTWDRATLEEKYITASESLGWCEFYMKEWERTCDQDKDSLLRSHNRLAIAISILAAVVSVICLGALGLAIGAWS